MEKNKKAVSKSTAAASKTKVKKPAGVAKPEEKLNKLKVVAKKTAAAKKTKTPLKKKPASTIEPLSGKSAVSEVKHPRATHVHVEPVIPKKEHKKEEPALHEPVRKQHIVAEHKLEAKKEVKPETQKAPSLKPEPKVVVPAKVKPPVIQKDILKPEIPAPVAIKETELKEVELSFPITLKDLAVKLQNKPSILIKDLMMMGIMANINQSLDEEIVAKLCQKNNFKVKVAQGKEELALGMHTQADNKEDLKPRSPIVTIMGHVDHGKTSILDAIRKSKVAESEHGGITQHIGAYRVKLPEGEITFLDTPGHEAFTAMRARGAKVTDIVVLVVAADDGIMPQTKEAIDHSKAAGVSIIVALNKIDKPQAEPDRVKKQLAELGLMAEDWGGKTITVPVSAKTGEGINHLLEMILLEAQMLELKANPNRLGKGIVLESKLVKNRGPVATLLVQNGTIHINDNIIVGSFYGKIRAMFNDRGQSVVSAGPSYPVEVLGITGIPAAGEQFYAIPEEKIAKELAEKRQEKNRQLQVQPVKRMGLEDLYTQIKEGKLKELKLILKADAQGSVEAIREAINKVNQEEVQLVIIHEGVGNINSSDVILAVASNALILGFNVTPDDLAKEIIEKEGQDVRVYNVIYELVKDIKAALVGMLEPKLKKVFLGRAEIKKVFKLSSSGTIAGCYVSKGKMNRHSVINLLRNGSVVYEGELSSLKRFKDDVREVQEGYECGMALKGFSELMEGDVIESYEIKKIARTLEE